MNTTIWLIGNKGMLGTELSNMLASRAHEFVGTDREVDITDPAALDAFASARAAEGKGIGFIINCAAYTAVDKAEDDADLCRRLNAEGPANIASCAKKIGARLLHISTDYVFNGNGDRPYREDDPTDPTGVYGLTKRDGETAAFSANPETWIIRTAWLYGKHGNNFVHTMLRMMTEKTELKVVNDQRGTPTWARDLCMAISTFIERAIQGNPAPWGIYHFSNEGNISWFDFAREIYRLGAARGEIDAARPFTLAPCTSAEFPAKVRRPPYSVLDKSKIRAVLGYEIPDWKTSLSAYLDSR
jgi:dTDP-4-dehydrorhamnose reductase